MRHRSGVIARYQSPRKRHSPSSCHYRLKWPWWSTQLPNAGRGWGQNDVWIRRLENTSRGSQNGTCTTTPHSRFYGCIVRIGIGDCCCSVPTILHWNICKNCFSFFFLKFLSFLHVYVASVVDMRNSRLVFPLYLSLSLCLALSSTIPSISSISFCNSFLPLLFSHGVDWRVGRIVGQNFPNTDHSPYHPSRS